MTQRLIDDAMVQTAFDNLQAMVEPAAAAKAERIRAEYGVKHARAAAFNKYRGEGTVEDRKSWAELEDTVQAAIAEEVKAVERDEYYRNQRDKCSTIIEAWRTQSSNERALGKVG